MEPLEVVLKKVKELRIDLSSDVVIQEERGHIEHSPPQCQLSAHSDYVIDQPRITKAQVARDELQKIYVSSEFQNARESAGKVLGYSSLRIWVNEHPIAATVTGIVAASGLVYLLVEHFSK